MAHVQIQQGWTPTQLKILVDGVDLSDHIYADGFGLVQVGEGFDSVWGVRMVLAADVLDVDLPDAVIEAARASDEGTA